jgi:hypothetical protein
MTQLMKRIGKLSQQLCGVNPFAGGSQPARIKLSDHGEGGHSCHFSSVVFFWDV